MERQRAFVRYSTSLMTASSKITELRNMEREVVRSPVLTLREKREEIDRIRQMRVRMLTRIAPLLDLTKELL